MTVLCKIEPDIVATTPFGLPPWLDLENNAAGPQFAGLVGALVSISDLGGHPPPSRFSGYDVIKGGGRSITKLVISRPQAQSYWPNLHGNWVSML